MIIGHKVVVHCHRIGNNCVIGNNATLLDDAMVGDVCIIAAAAVGAKSNIGPDDRGFAYALDRVEVAPDVEGQRVQWLEALDGTARELLADAEADPSASEETSALADAIEFLASELRDGPKPAKAIFREARDAGHSERPIKRAKSELRAESRKEKAGWLGAAGQLVQGGQGCQ